MTTNLQTMTDEILEKLHQILTEVRAARREFAKSNKRYLEQKTQTPEV